MAEALQEQMRENVNEIRKIDTEQGKMTETLSKYEAQRQENDTVKDELGRLEDGAKVFKLIGPVLVPQDLEEAKDNVKKRLEFITGEIDRYTKTHEGLGDKRKEIIGKCQDIQKKMQDLQAAEKKDKEKGSDQ
eukprot:m.12213 g.12213  ORF g.12213 m.12213 type:complete len:133 (-) comp4613_c0_seq1:20-418(-)